MFRTQSDIQDRDFAKIVNSGKPLTPFAKSSILDVSLDTKCTAGCIGEMRMEVSINRKA